ncbi:MAG: aconitate hydratase AcnA [Alphaproteobacteria bacterium]|nr:aconitate hydratase AcnA [Alphaproteobacteria bacterium]MBN9566687.1 aconitate hydratase AcnA [Alphaproteobacteria bacterium]MBN9577955.1 aconitate hydratase AcnA [Alphaproteobacteria bacterium]OJU55926.1 MAG: aconitate hydratase 1 [Alphaproteobacteria bacterium 62-8]
MTRSLDSFKSRRKMTVAGKEYTYFSLTAAEKNGLKGISRLPYSLKVLLENLLRHEDGQTVTAADIKAIAAWLRKKTSDREIAFRPARVLMQDLTGVPAVVDLAAMRDAMKALGGDPEKINPLAEVDLVIDHSVMVDNFGLRDAFKKNVAIEYQRNGERYAFLRWGQQAFANFRVVPPGTGICHQVNLEYLGQTVWSRKIKEDKKTVEYAFPDTLVGTDSHTTMINALSVLGWGVGGIEAEAAMLGQPISMLIPEVIGFRITGKLREGVTATDLVLTVTEMLRKKGVVGKFVEFYGPGLDEMALEDRATIANMSPEYGATCGFFPIDAETLRYLKGTARKPARVALVEKYAKAQGLFRSKKSEEPVFTDKLSLDLGTVVPSLAGPRRPQDRVSLTDASAEFANALINTFGKEADANRRVKLGSSETSIGHGDVVIAAITSCTNTSNPSVMIGAGLVAKKAVERGLKVRPWVKTSLAPGSQVVTDYLEKAGLNKFLDKLGFNLVGYGCTTCIGNSGPLPDAVANAVTEGDLVAAAVLSGNRNFEGRVHPQVRANYLASPMLVVAYALAGSMNVNLTSEPVGYDKDNEPVYLKDIWPSPQEISQTIRKAVKASSFRARYGNVFDGGSNWKKVKFPKGKTYAWDKNSTYVKNPPYFDGMTAKPAPLTDIEGARVLALFGDSITTDHISPAGSIKKDGPAGRYLIGRGVAVKDFNSYGSRRGNDEVMVRGTFANIRIKNEMLGGREGGDTLYYADANAAGEEMSIFDAAMKYKADGVPVVVIGGKEYGTGSSRDWAAKGPLLLGVSAVITESFERIHRSNLIGMGVAPFVFEAGKTRKDYGLTGRETIDIPGLSGKLSPRMKVEATIHYPDGRTAPLPLHLMILTADEIAYFENGGILQYVLRNLVAA